MNGRWFTPDTARRALPRVRTVTEALCAVFREMESRAPGLAGSDRRVDADYFRLVCLLHRGLATLARLGVQIKDLRRGRIDFPSRRDGREVALSWRLGEPTLAFWHEAGSGRGRRRPLDEDGPWDDPSGGCGFADRI